MKKALSGLRPWLVQRFTAVYMLLFMVWALGCFAVDAPHSYAAWHTWMTSIWVLITTALFFLAFLPQFVPASSPNATASFLLLGARVSVLAALALALIGLALWMLQILLLAPH